MTGWIARSAVVALAIAATCGGARADVVQTADGQWKGLPAGSTLGPKDQPSEEMLVKSAAFKVEAALDTVKARGWSTSAGLVGEMWASDQATVASFKEGIAQYGAGLFEDAAESFAKAASEEDVSPFGKQQALYYRVRALVDASRAKGAKLPEALAAIDELLAAFPTSYYFAEGQVLRARLELGNDDAVARALDSIKNAKGMNRRDVLGAEYQRIFLTLEQGKKHPEAKAAYEALVKESEKGDPLEVGGVRERARIGIANVLLRLNQADEAKAAYAKALSASSDPDVLAAAHAGLGDVSFGTAKRLQDAKKMDEAKAALVDATEHYLRVTLVYRDLVTDATPVLTSLENQAKAFAAIFDQSDGKDCVSAARAYTAYFDLHGMLDGAQKRRIALEAAAFNSKRKEKGCK